MAQARLRSADFGIADAASSSDLICASLRASTFTRSANYATSKAARSTAILRFAGQKRLLLIRNETAEKRRCYLSCCDLFAASIGLQPFFAVDSAVEPQNDTFGKGFNAGFSLRIADWKIVGQV